MAKAFPKEAVEHVFKAYDIRGRVPEPLGEELVYGIGQAYVNFVKPKKVAVGYDARSSGPRLSAILTQSLRDHGADVVNLGACGTEQVYFATFHGKLDGGIMVTASHNPPQDNGLKIVRGEARPVSSETGLKQMAQCLVTGDLPGKKWFAGKTIEKNILPEYCDSLWSSVDLETLKPFKIVVNCCNGTAAKTLDALATRLPFQIVKVLEEPDGSFPKGPPNPLLPEHQRLTSEAVRREKADFGVAWDGDFDRCFFFDERGEFIDAYYVVGLLAKRFLDAFPGERIVHDPRLTWDTLDVIERNSGIAVQNKSGHAFMKDRMRNEHAVFGGETSGHFYFRNFGYCDSGMLPFLYVAELLSTSGLKLSEAVGERRERFPISGEINREIASPGVALMRIREKYAPSALKIDEMDGVSFEFKEWRFNLRLSNTEPLIRLNVETRGNRALLQEKTEEILKQLHCPN